MIIKSGAGAWNLTFSFLISPFFLRTSIEKEIFFFFFADCVYSVSPAVPPRGQRDPHVSLRGGNRVRVRVCGAPAIHEHQVGQECSRLLHPPIIGSGTIWNNDAVIHF